MIILVQDRKNNFHMADYTSFNGNKYTVCNLIYTKKDIINTFALDKAVQDFCPKCYEYFSALELDTLNNWLRDTYSKLNMKIQFQYDIIKGPQNELSNEYDDLNTKYWPKLARYKRKLARKP